MRFAENPVKIKDAVRQWEGAGRGIVDSRGNFECLNLRPGKYYLTLSIPNETLAISDIFELGKSQRLDNITFHTGTGKVQIHIIDAETGQGISNAGFSIINDLNTYFYSKLLMPEGSYDMVTDAGPGRIYKPS